MCLDGLDATAGNLNAMAGYKCDCLIIRLASNAVPFA
jgi:hypothetical protein